MTFWKHEKEPTPQVTVIGTSTMGAAMGRGLLGSGIDVSVWSRHWASMSPLVDRGATAYVEAWEAALEDDVVISMLPIPEPAAGSREPAETGQLLTLASGPEQAAQRFDPVFSLLGKPSLGSARRAPAAR
jgi:3-hydroxyisobutyrate dehydrogenase-like beta-hydroxyacid dehydrogenase